MNASAEQRKPTRYHAITTTNARIWESYGRTMATTFDRFWSDAITLTIFAEDFVAEGNGHIRFADLGRAAPWLEGWKMRRTSEQLAKAKQSYKWDAVRFSHKVAAIGAAADDVSRETDVLVWIDIDVVTHGLVAVEWLDSLLPADADMAWLDRLNYYPESGFMMFRLPNCTEVIRRIVTAYQTGEIFQCQQWHDAWIVQIVCGAAQKTQGLRIASLSGNAEGKHPLVTGPLGACLDHLKGRRKDLGRSPEAVGKRTEPYWL